MAENEGFGSSKWTKKRRSKRLATEDVDNILKEAEAKKNRSVGILIHNIPHLMLSDVDTFVYPNDQVQIRYR
ncbi:hypothetical protein OUZ56_012903 [Daphnia magna]|uniref:Uncharacterized protein n=1 Tax=Daphnia magna TaxID=35525 RepID=A0ABQ9Z5I4_9CRUS|nr:hypothetical protein OUZ56_012903 [Daphnia magna]